MRITEPPRPFLFICILLAVHSLHAQTGARAFNLQSAIQYALQNNLDLRVLARRADAARADITVARELNNPDFVGEATRSQPNYFLSAGYLFELGGKRGTRIGIAQSEAQIANLNLDAAQRTLRHDVRIAYYQLLQSRSKLTEISKSRHIAEELLNITKERFEAGDVPRLEVLQADLELKRRENELQEAQNDAKASAVHFNVLLNLDPQAQIEPEGTLEESLPNVSLQTLLDQAVAQRVDIKTLQAEQTAQQGRVSLAQKERIPDLQVEAGTEIHDQDFQYGWRTNLTLEVPVFNFRKGEIAGATATLQSLKSEQSAEEQKIRSEVTESFLKYQTADFRVENFRKQLLPAVAELEDLSQQSYHEGKASIVSAIDAQRNSFEVRLEYLEALMDYQTAVADLEQSAGVELR
jgi:outer membrane protein, heavy metal efflux system